MTYAIDLLSIQTPKHLRKGFENRTRFDCGSFEINIFETFQSSTKVQIQYEGLSISGMIRGRKVVHAHDGKSVEFLPGTSLILPEGETVYADFPDADQHRPVQCATLLIPHVTLEELLRYFEANYPKQGRKWELDFHHYHIHNNSPLVRAFNELLQLTQSPKQNMALYDLLLKSFLVRIIDAQDEHIREADTIGVNDQLFLIKQYIKGNLSSDISIEQLMQVGNCGRSTLYRMFDSYCSKSPGEYILKERMSLARNLLLDPNHNISDVAFRSGFSSVSYFTKQFKSQNNCTPRDFIKKFGV